MVRTVHISVLGCGAQLVVQDTAQNSSDNLRYVPDSNHYSNMFIPP